MANRQEIVQGVWKVDVGLNNNGVWCWALSVYHGEVYDPEYGERAVMRGEEVAEEDKVWRPHAHGQTRREHEAWNASAAAAEELERTMDSLAQRARLASKNAQRAAQEMAEAVARRTSKEA